MRIDLTPVFTKLLPPHERNKSFDALLCIPLQFLHGEIELVVVQGKRGVGAPSFVRLHRETALAHLCDSPPPGIEIYAIYGDFSSSPFRWRLRKIAGQTENLELCLIATSVDLNESRAQEFEIAMEFCYGHGLCDGALIDYTMWRIKRRSLQFGQS